MSVSSYIYKLKKKKTKSLRQKYLYVQPSKEISFSKPNKSNLKKNQKVIKKPKII